MPRRVSRLYPAYGLYLYGEGLYAQETQLLRLTGAPVLFLPGNAGSYKQGRMHISLWLQWDFLFVLYFGQLNNGEMV